MTNTLRWLCTLALVWSSFVFAADKKTLTFGIAQPYGDEQAAKAKAVLEPYLTTALAGPVTVTVFPSYEALSDALAGGTVDLAWITPLAFVHATQKNSDVEALLKAMRSGDGGLFYRSILVVKKDSPVTKLADLKGKKVAWVNKLSASGYLFPREILRKENFDPDKFFSDEAFLGDHLAVCKAVREGKADVGATFARGTEEGVALKADGCDDAPPSSDFRIVASTGSLPNEVIAASAAFPPVRTNDVIAVFGRMGKTEAGKKVLRETFRSDGFGIAVAGDFDPVLALLRVNAKAKVAPSEAKKTKQ